MKKYLLALMVLCSMCATAQDMIVKKDGSTIFCRVLHLTSTEVVYKEWNHQNGPNHSVARSEVRTIDYEGMVNGNEGQNHVNPLKEQEMPSDILKSAGLFYLADFNGADKGVYGMKFDIFMPQQHWGVTWSIGTNAGLVDSEYSGVHFTVGPSAIVEIMQPVYLVCPLRFNGSVRFGKDENKKDKTYFNWGVDLAPGLMFSSNKWTVQAAFDISWAKGCEKLGTGFMVGIGYDL